MSDMFLVALVGSVPSTLTAIATLIVAVRNSRKVEEVHRATNSMKDELVALTRAEAHAAGAKEERDRAERRS